MRIIQNFDNCVRSRQIKYVADDNGNGVRRDYEIQNLIALKMFGEHKIWTIFDRNVFAFI